MVSRRMALVGGTILVPSVHAQPVGALSITNVGGYSDNVGVANGRWTGQPMAGARSNAYLDHYVVAAPTDAARNVTTGATYYWTIAGNNFGAAQGSVWLLDGKMNGIRGVQLTIQSWSNTSIRVIANAPHTFTSHSGASLWVSRLRTKPAPASSLNWSSRSHRLVGLIQSRGYGQCTWYVARTRLARGLAIPPSAYAQIGSLAAVGGSETGYVPQQWDCLAYAGLHVAIITSPVTRTASADGSLSYAFTVSEMNAATDERESSSARLYRLSRPDARGRRTVVQMIGSNAGAAYVATGYYR